MYLYRAIDKHWKSLDFMQSRRRDKAAASSGLQGHPFSSRHARGYRSRSHDPKTTIPVNSHVAVQTVCQLGCLALAILDEISLPKTLRQSPALGDALREQVLARDGVLIMRPDSGDPMQIVPDVIEALMARFGHTTTAQGYKLLHEKARAAGGDAGCQRRAGRTAG